MEIFARVAIAEPIPSPCKLFFVINQILQPASFMQANLFTAVLLPTALAIIMLGMGLTLIPDDFQRIRRYPKAVVVGLVNQLILLPLIGFLITFVVPMEPAIAVGLMILAICPGGPSSNLITYFAKGDVALSITLTAFSSTITVFTIPLLTQVFLQYFMGQTSAVTLPVGQMMGQVFLITLFPVSIGMVIRYRFPGVAAKLERVISRLAIAFLVLILLAILIIEWKRLPGFFVQVGVSAFLLNVLATLVGFYSSKLAKLPIPQQICIAIEVGVQNGTLAIAITAGLLNNPDMAVPAAIYSVFMNLMAFAAIAYGRRLALAKA
ncbi:putative Na+-dependent transporter [Leptolyngbyaceae cyanobacterium JSC-12]|nr:putative Na+-dependent transporter [Leptolyngbyaceae cyanobacterium JSC-12]